MLIEKMHEMYLNDPVTQDITDAIDSLISSLAADLDEIDAERLLNFAVTYLGIMEKELGVSDVSGELDERRDRVRAALLSRGAVNLEGAVQIGTALLGYADGEYSPLEFLYTPIVAADASESDVNNYSAALRAYLPAHILIGAAVYYRRTHNEIKAAALTHNYLSAYTHKEIGYKAVI